jgi:hypothetical protein
MLCCFLVLSGPASSGVSQVTGLSAAWPSGSVIAGPSSFVTNL